MPQFIYPVRTTKTTLQCRDITQGTHKAFAKMLLNNDAKCLNTFIDELINEIVIDAPKDLTVIDKLLILLEARCYSISPVLEFSKKEGKSNLNFTVNINDTIDIILKQEFNKFVFNELGISCEATLPRNFFYDDIEDIIADSIDVLVINEEPVDINFTLDQKRELVSKLPNTILTKFISFLETQDKNIKDIVVVKLPKQLAEEEYNLSIYGSELLPILNLCYYLDLASIHHNEYHLIKSHGFNMEQINKTSPNELALYYKFIEEEAKKAKQEAEAANQTQNIVPASFANQG